MANLDQLLNIAYMIGIIASICGAFFVGKRARIKESITAAAQLNETLEKEVDALRRRVVDLERDRSRQYEVLDTIRYALKQKGLKIIIDGDFVTLADQSGVPKITRIKTRQQTAQLAQGDDDEDAS